MSAPFASSSSTVDGVDNDRFAHLQRIFALQPVEKDLYRSVQLVQGGRFRPAVYGGLLFAQALRAAEETVADGLLPYSIHSVFLLPGSAQQPIDYRVTRIRDGRSFCTRLVQAEQGGQVIYTLQASFHIKEPDAFSHQDTMPRISEPDQLDDTRSAILRILKDDETGQRAGGSLNDLQRKYLNRRLVDLDDDDENSPVFIEFRPVDPDAFLMLKDAGTTTLTWMKANLQLSDDSLMHRMMTAYASDSTLLSAGLRTHGSRGFIPSMMFSLDHCMWLHDDRFRADEWMLYETHSPIAKGSRVFCEGRLWSRDGRLIATMTQEGLIRAKLPEKSKL